MKNSFFNSSTFLDEAEAPTLPIEPPTQPNAIWVNLRDYGFAKAGVHHGDASALRNLFNQIRQGFILDENANGEKQHRERERIDEAITTLELNQGELQTQIRRIKETEIPKVEAEINHIDSEIEQIELAALTRETNPSHRSRFDMILYWIVFIPATVFVYLFYVSAFHSSFYRNVLGAATKAAENDSIGDVLNAIFNREAFFVFDLHWLAPTVFFVFGLVLHIVYDGTGWSRWLKLLGTLLLILVADGLLAYFIEEKNQQVKMLMPGGNPDYHFYTSEVFYMVLMMGFFTCMGWSIILHQIKEEHKKLDIEKIMETQVLALKEKRLTRMNQIQDLKATLVLHEGKIELILLEIKKLIQKREKISLSLFDLEKRITDFYDGWLSFVNQIRQSNGLLKEECEAVLKEFRFNHFSTLLLSEA